MAIALGQADSSDATRIYYKIPARPGDIITIEPTSLWTQSLFFAEPLCCSDDLTILQASGFLPYSATEKHDITITTDGTTVVYLGIRYQTITPNAIKPPSEWGVVGNDFENAFIVTTNGAESTSSPYNGCTLIVGADGVVRAEHNQHTISPWKNVAHRGYPVGVRENTVPSFYEALKDNCPMVECDVRLTSDGVAVLCHDATITGTVSGVSTTMTIADSTLEQLRTLVLSSSTVYGEVKIPTLEEALAFMSYHGMSVNLDIKDDSDACITEIVRLVKRYNMGERTTYFNGTSPATALAKVLDLDSNARVIFYYSNISSVDAVTTDSKRVVIALQPYELSDAVVATIRGKGYAMYCWGVTTSTYPTAFNYFPDYVEYTTGTGVTDILEAHLNNITFW